jgi:protein-arginine kinase activator protein McsA
MNQTPKRPCTPESIAKTQGLALKFARRLSEAKVAAEFSIIYCEECGTQSLFLDSLKLSQSRAFVYRQARDFAKKNRLNFTIEKTACPSCGESFAERLEHSMEFGSAGLEESKVELHHNPVIEAQ